MTEEYHVLCFEPCSDDDIRQGGEVLTHTRVRFNYRSLLLSSLAGVVLRVTACYDFFGSARIRFKDFYCYNQ